MDRTIEIPCGYCGSPFKPKRQWQRFCSDKHRTKYNNDRQISEEVDAHSFRLLVRHFPLPPSKMLEIIQQERAA